MLWLIAVALAAPAVCETLSYDKVHLVRLACLYVVTCGLTSPDVASEVFVWHTAQVDYASVQGGVTNYFFRGNMPMNDSTSPPSFAYSDLVQYVPQRLVGVVRFLSLLVGDAGRSLFGCARYMRQRAQEANLSFPVNEDPYIIDISLCNTFDGCGGMSARPLPAEIRTRLVVDRVVSPVP